VFEGTEKEQHMHLTLLPNPSHLECVAPVVLGKARAKADLVGDDSCSRVLPVNLHGDAAFAGQGIVDETMQLARVPSYYTGGSIHIVCNNQVGFTTDPGEARSTPYATDLGKAFSAPIFHVNADKLEDVAHVFDMATAYRQRWASDVVIDLVGYRRHGHNEIDQPLLTQPQMYAHIAKHGTPLAIYKAQLLADGVSQVR
jgi:2-oxoglutarate dehydrogenase E1 component